MFLIFFAAEMESSLKNLKDENTRLKKDINRLMEELALRENFAASTSRKIFCIKKKNIFFCVVIVWSLLIRI